MIPKGRSVFDVVQNLEIPFQSPACKQNFLAMLIGQGSQ
jgi:hypothetical protein